MMNEIEYVAVCKQEMIRNHAYYYEEIYYQIPNIHAQIRHLIIKCLSKLNVYFRFVSSLVAM